MQYNSIEMNHAAIWQTDPVIESGVSKCSKRRSDFFFVVSASVRCPRTLFQMPPRRLGYVIAIKVHHLGPRGNESLHERLFRVARRIDLCKGPKLGV